MGLENRAETCITLHQMKESPSLLSILLRRWTCRLHGPWTASDASPRYIPSSPWNRFCRAVGSVSNGMFASIWMAVSLNRIPDVTYLFWVHSKPSIDFPAAYYLPTAAAQTIAERIEICWWVKPFV
jgi:hypothetical protein